MATYELTEAEKKFGAIPGQSWREVQTNQQPSTTELLGRSATLGTDRPAYKPMYPSKPGAITPATATQPARFDYLPQTRESMPPRATMARNPSVRYALDLGMPSGEQTSDIYKSASKRGGVTYEGVGTGAVSPAQQARDTEMQARGMVHDPYGNWAPSGGWGVSANGFGGATQEPSVVTRGPYRGLSGQLFEDTTPIQQGGGQEPPDMSSLPALAAWSARTRAAGKERAATTAQRGALALGAQREAGETARAGLRESREDARTRLAAELRREPSALELAQAKEAEARTGVLGTEKAQKEMALKASKRDEVAQEMVNNPKDYYPEEVARARAHLQKKFEEQKMLALIKSGQYEPPTAGMADGGVVRGFAKGGAITEPITQTQQVNPAIAQYGQYLNAAAQSGIAPVPFAQYMNLLQSTRGAMQTTPTQFADGGDVSALGRPLEGPGTGRSDSIPAVIDGGQPAALSDGEFVIPAHVVRAKGTEFFEKLLAQYAEGAKDNG